MTKEEEFSEAPISSAAAANKNAEYVKPQKSKQTEIKMIGNFLLQLYHRLIIGPQTDWLCRKSDIQKEFQQFVIAEELSEQLENVKDGDNIGVLLQRCGFLLRNTTTNTAADDDDDDDGFLVVYKLNSEALKAFRNRTLKEHDKQRINPEMNSKQTAAGPEDALRNVTENKINCILQVNYEIDEDSPQHVLEYQGSTKQIRRQNYYATNMSCFICQEDFATMVDYEEHIQIHNVESDFKFVDQLNRSESPLFAVSYRLCKNSHYFRFTLETQNENLIIEKLIIVQSRSMFYVHNMHVPYDMPANGIENFFVDSHLFVMFVEQPIVVICHQKDDKDMRFIEEHHFMRVLEFPKVNFSINPYRLPSSRIFKAKHKLDEYFPPLNVRNALQNDNSCNKFMEISSEFHEYERNHKTLQPQKMGGTLISLLHIEDVDTIKDYLNIIQHNVKLRSFGDDYSMRIVPKRNMPIENVLSVFDDVLITARSDIKKDAEGLINLLMQNAEVLEENGYYLGKIENIYSRRVSFKCYGKLNMKLTYTVLFRPSRLQLRYQYRALKLLQRVMPQVQKFLFPADIETKPLPLPSSLELYNKTIANNPEQLQAVQNIASGPRNDATYIIFGPPGTGKTTTVVESILQVLKRSNETKILVTASSNGACDEVALRLCKELASIDLSRAIVRIYSKSNEARIDTIDDLLLDHSNMYNGHFYPDVEVIHEYRIVICTLAVVGKLALGNFGGNNTGGSRSLFTHLFIDEVAASTEVEALGAIATILPSCLIIAGDNKQLGPIIKSKRAQEYKLDVSLMDRLLDCECYRPDENTGEYDRTIQTRLRKNFRSHPEIVNLYSEMYYKCELEAKANIDDVSLVKQWHLAPNKDYPIIFHSIEGETCSDNRSFSLYNSDELAIVMDYVKDLMYFGINGKPVKECDIGVISPYKRQYLRIREEFNLRKWYQIETGSVETFQGKEKDIIIVSFVRSGTKSLGFLESERRLNVTLSRAKSLLILVGNAKTLSLNSDYDYIVKECQRNNTFIEEVDNRNTTSSVSIGLDNDDVKPMTPLNIICQNLKDLNVNSSAINYDDDKSISHYMWYQKLKDLELLRSQPITYKTKNTIHKAKMDKEENCGPLSTGSNTKPSHESNEPEIKENVTDNDDAKPMTQLNIICQKLKDLNVNSSAINDDDDKSISHYMWYQKLKDRELLRSQPITYKTKNTIHKAKMDKEENSGQPSTSTNTKSSHESNEPEVKENDNQIQNLKEIRIPQIFELLKQKKENQANNSKMHADEEEINCHQLSTRPKSSQIPFGAEIEQNKNQLQNVKENKNQTTQKIQTQRVLENVSKVKRTRSGGRGLVRSKNKQTIDLVNEVACQSSSLKSLQNHQSSVAAKEKTKLKQAISLISQANEKDKQRNTQQLIRINNSSEIKANAIKPKIKAKQTLQNILLTNETLANKKEPTTGTQQLIKITNSSEIRANSKKIRSRQWSSKKKQSSSPKCKPSTLKTAAQMNQIENGKDNGKREVPKPLTSKTAAAQTKLFENGKREAPKPSTSKTAAAQTKPLKALTTRQQKEKLLQNIIEELNTQLFSSNTNRADKFQTTAGIASTKESLSKTTTAHTTAKSKKNSNKSINYALIRYNAKVKAKSGKSNKASSSSSTSKSPTKNANQTQSAKQQKVSKANNKESVILNESNTV